MKVYISQSNYIPWKGYFDAVDRADTMVIYDHVQYTKGDWRNRNIIRTSQGSRWLTIPVHFKSRSQRIKDIEVASHSWADRHWHLLQDNYRDASHFNALQESIERLYGTAEKLHFLSEINYLFLEHLLSVLGIKTNVIKSAEVNPDENPTKRLVNICRDLGAETYLTGPSAVDYLELDQFREAGIHVEWMDYSHYKPYPQIHEGFEERVSVLDVLFNCGPEARKYILHS